MPTILARVGVISALEMGAGSAKPDLKSGPTAAGGKMRQHDPRRGLHQPDFLILVGLGGPRRSPIHEVSLHVARKPARQTKTTVMAGIVIDRV